MDDLQARLTEAFHDELVTCRHRSMGAECVNLAERATLVVQVEIEARRAAVLEEAAQLLDAKFCWEAAEHVRAMADPSRAPVPRPAMSIREIAGIAPWWTGGVEPTELVRRRRGHDDETGDDQR